MTSTKAVTTFRAKLDVDKNRYMLKAVEIFQDAMQRIEDERATLEDTEFEVGDGKVEFEFRLEDENGYKQDSHKEIVDAVIDNIMEHPSDGNLIDYRSNRIETEEEDADEG